MNKPELLLPAGNIEKMQYALNYGADAVYLGVKDFSLRNTRQGDTITRENLKEAVNICHAMGKRVYVTINIFAHNKDLEAIPEFLEFLNDIKPDAIIFSDIGIGNLIKKYSPKIDMHLSTQANTTNYASAQAWKDFGVKRIILARELSLSEIEEIKNKVSDLELEVFIHGSLCISYSGRCVLSDYMTDNERKSNNGGCSHPCRWRYKLIEETRPNEHYEITEDERGTYILNTRDICLAEHIQDLINVGVDSFKVEGRTKSLYYVSVVSRAYREIIDKILNNEKIDYPSYIKELAAAGNRGFTTNFLLGKPKKTDYNYETSKGKAGLTFLGNSLSDTIDNNKLLIRARNQIKLNDEIEWITPLKTYKDIVKSIESDIGEDLTVANTNNKIYLTIPKDLDSCKWTIIRG